MANYSCKKVFYDLKLSHNTSVTNEQTDREMTTTMPIARPLLKYGRLKTTGINISVIVIITRPIVVIVVL